MSRKDKLLKRLLLFPKDFTFAEVVTVLATFGFYEVKVGKTSGSVVRFKNDDLPYEPIIFHKPHPHNIVKKYVLKSIVSCLMRCNLINNENEGTKGTDE